MQVLPFHGYTSLSSLYGASEIFRDEQEAGKQVHIYYFGDHDPSGRDIDRAALATLRDDFYLDDIDYQRVAVTEAQIDTYQLPTRPTKVTDSRAGQFDGESVEIDAMPRDVLLSLVEECITQHLPAAALGRLRAGEEAERASALPFLTSFARSPRRQRPLDGVQPIGDNAAHGSHGTPAESAQAAPHRPRPESAGGR